MTASVSGGTMAVREDSDGASAPPPADVSSFQAENRCEVRNELRMVFRRGIESENGEPLHDRHAVTQRPHHAPIAPELRTTTDLIRRRSKHQSKVSSPATGTGDIAVVRLQPRVLGIGDQPDRKSTRLNSSHLV